jgi:Concanavalin A-like lectin/glucanases superfamily/Immunoglobulin I-set domain/Immunoglobulin domain
MLNLTPIRTHLLVLSVALAGASVARADFNPIQLTPGSFTADVVIEKSAPPPYQAYVNVTMDGGTNNNGNTWYEMGYASALPNTGLPHPGATFTSITATDHQFMMPPAYTTNNCLYIGGANAPGTSTFVTHVASGTLTLTTPTAASTISILNSGGGANTLNYTIHHQGGGTETGSFATLDWFNAAGSDWTAGGRVNMDNGTLNTLTSTTQTKLFHNDIILTDTVNPVTSVDFSYSSGTSRSFIFGVSVSTGGNFTPVAVTGFNKDVIVEASALRVGFVSATTVTMDQGINNFANTFYEKGLRPNDTASGLPTHGSTFTNAAGDHIFTMPPTYVGNDCLFIANQTGFTTGTLTITTPAACSALSLLTSAGNGPLVMAYTIHYADSTTQAGSVSVTDWFNAATPAYFPNGRFVPDTLAFNNVGTTTGSHIYNNDIALNNIASPVTSIDFAYTSGGRGPIFAISGQTNSGGKFFPLGISGFDADIVAEAGLLPHLPNSGPSPLTNVTTVSMDGGTNDTGNTWYEQGWYSQMPNSGLPAPGSTINSIAQPNNHYQMPASYTANNCVFVDFAHTNANLTPITPSAFSALSFLSATANNNVTNRVIIQYLDGTSETNLFVSTDWFNNNPYAYDANGRASIDNRCVNTDAGHGATPSNPRLYEAQCFLGNFTSPVTNVVLQFLGAVNATTGRMVVMAVSGATGPVAPIMNAPSLSSVTTYEHSNLTFSVGNVQGSPSITNQWQISTDGGANFVNLNDGGNISGSKTPALLISNVSIANTAQYKLISSNPYGTTTSGTATLTVLSGYPNVAKPGDPIAIYPPGSTSNTGETVDHAIDNLVGADPAKYLNNSGAGSGFIVTPSQGSTIIKAMRFFTANDTQGRDPASFTLEGSNDGGNTWAAITNFPLTLSATRNSAASAAVNPLTQTMTEVDFYDNVAGYLTYRVIFPTLQTPGTPLMQIGEVQMLGMTNPVGPIIVRQPASTITVWAGGMPTFGLTALGTPPLSYQWYRNGNLIPGATNATYTTNNVQLSDSGSTFLCTVSNPFGPTNSTSAILVVINGAPTNSYPAAVLADHPFAFWRLDELNGSPSANDYVGGHNGDYISVLNEQPGYNPLLDSDFSSGFGGAASATQDSHVGNIQDINFAAPTNNTVALSVEAWVNGSGQSVDAGIITKGYGGGGEQFDLDTGGNPSGATPSLHTFRFFFHDAGGNIHGAAVSPVAPDGKWHHLVGVLDEARSSIVLYVDGLVSGVNTTLSPSNGLLISSVPVTIGARQTVNGGPFDLQFSGFIDEAAIYNTALSSNQVLAHFYAAHLPPLFALQPTNTTAHENGSATLKSLAYGPPSVTLQWYQSTDGGANFTALAGKTNSNLAFANTPLSQSGFQYYVVATDPYGATTSSIVTLTVISGPPGIDVDLPPITVVYAGANVSLSVDVGGTAPLSYQWSGKGAPLTDGGRISGARSNVLTISNCQAADSGIYQLAVTNGYNVGNPVLSSPTFLYVETTPDFNTNGAGWTVNGGATFANNTATLTDNAGSEARSTWYNYPLYIGNFYAAWVYRDVLAAGADGASFCIQNDPRGTAALGGGGGSLGVAGITPSAELEFNIYSPNTVGIAYHVNGAVGGYTTPSPVGIDSSDPIYVTLRYNGAVAHVTLTDSNALTSFSTDLPIGDITALLGGTTAYVGFTGATGGTASQQTVSNFYFLPLPALTAQVAAGNTLVLSWPASIGGYTLQSKADLGSGSWQNVTAPAVQVGGQNQVTVSSSSGNQFYRLLLVSSGAQ